MGATTSEVLYSLPFCQLQTGERKIDFLGNTLPALTFTTLPDQFYNGTDVDHTCTENYFAISTGLGGFPNAAVYVSVIQGGAHNILKVGTPAPFATLPAGFDPA